MSNENLCFGFRLQKVLLKAQCDRFYAILQGPLSGATYWVSIQIEILNTKASKMVHDGNICIH